jgi:hypothetical protein
MRFSPWTLLLIGSALYVAGYLPLGVLGLALAAGQAEVIHSSAGDTWTKAAGELAEKIVARAAPQTTLALSVRNVSSLGDDDVTRIRRALRSELRNCKIRLTTNQQIAAEVQVTLSENVEGLVWVAEIQNGAARDVAMVAVPRPPTDAPRLPAELLVVRITRIYQQPEPMLDVVPLTNSSNEGSGQAAPSVAKLLVLDAGAVSLYEKGPTHDKPAETDRSTWQLKASMPFSRQRPCPRDPRGRLIVRTDNQFDVYLPGAKCTGTLEPPVVQCQEGDEPWPLGAHVSAFFTPDRSYYDGRIRLEDGHEIKAPPFFAAVMAPANAAGATHVAAGAGLKPGPMTGVTLGGAAATTALLLLAGLDGRVQLVDREGGSITNLEGLGSVIAGVQTGCRSGWQILAAGAGDWSQPDSVQAYELINHKLLEASSPSEFAGPVTELWPLANGSEAMAIAHSLKTGQYEAYRVSMACGL